ncbi:MAG: glycosyltransferase family 2 protein [Candidatus Elarobacter sp.]
MAAYPLSDRFLNALTHCCAAAGLAYIARASQVARGWQNVPLVGALADAPTLSIVVPARNEERTIARCVTSLLAQTHPEYEVIVVDDRSEDRTPEILARIAREDSRVRVVRGEPLPEGWVGKPWALSQGARVARGAWLLFTDADTYHAAQACTSALAYVRRRGVDALTLGTFQELGTFAERAVLPTVLGLILVVSGPTDAINDPAQRDRALANGQDVLISRDAYDALGGYDALRGEIAEDLARAKHLKADGRCRLLLAGGERLVSVRMYTSLSELWGGFTKNMYVGAEGDIGKLAAGMVLLSLLSVVPAALAADAAVRKKPFRAAEALLCLAAGIAVQAHGLQMTSLPRRLAWYAPIGYALTAAIVLDSTVRVLSGRGVTWRGRRYSGRGGTPAPPQDRQRPFPGTSAE